MKNLVNIVKRWIFFIIISYIFIIVLFLVLVIIPQKNQIIKYKTEKELLEYNYLKIKNTPSFFNAIERTIKIIEDKINNFEWLNFSDDPTLTVYEYLEKLSSKSGNEIISMKKAENKSDQYYVWEIKVHGNFSNFISFLYDLENGNKYLKIEEIEILSGEKEKDFFNLKIAGIKREK
ncbi:MAG: hypothetical protein N2589_04370 [bacterium]|nr:hypothetical protein [bacterium]